MQAASLDELRSRTGLLLAAASIAGSFLGAQAANHPGIGLLGIAAMIAFVFAVGCCLYILWPRKQAWTFVLSAKTLAADWIDIERDGGVEAMQRFMAESLESHYDTNGGKLDELFGYFQAAAIAVGAEVILWTVQLAVG
jgi:hypothetical protein